jgi:hypothetical protein
MRFSYRLSAAIAMTVSGIFAVAVPAAAGARQRAVTVPGGTQVWAQRFGGARWPVTAPPT